MIFGKFSLRGESEGGIGEDGEEISWMGGGRRGE